MLNEETSPAIENPDDPAVAKKDDPAFLYFPTNYRWSMGLLICLSGAPWTGVEIDEVNRVGRALTDKVGDDDAWFEEWARMGDKTLHYEKGGESGQTTFNYTEDIDGRIITDWFERISETERHLIDLERVVKYDKLGVNNRAMAVAMYMSSSRG